MNLTFCANDRGGVRQDTMRRHNLKKKFILHPWR